LRFCLPGGPDQAVPFRQVKQIGRCVARADLRVIVHARPVAGVTLALSTDWNWNDLEGEIKRLSGATRVVLIPA
jgi:hypothetical protein